MRGDVDGDGRADLSYTYFGRPTDCNYLVVDSTAFGRVALRVPRPDFDDPLAPGVPFVRLLARIDESAGAELFVTTHEGAATAFASVYLFKGSRLIRARIPTCCGLPSTFSYGGTPDDFYGLDCVGHRGSGFVAWDGMHWVGGRRRPWLFKRTVYRLVGTAFVRKGQVERRVKDAPSGFGIPLFKRCAVAPT